MKIASFGTHKEIRQLNRYFLDRIPRKHVIYKYKGYHDELKDLVNLTKLNCSLTQITSIPRELVNLTKLVCSGTEITEIPKELVNLRTDLPRS